VPAADKRPSTNTITPPRPDRIAFGTSPRLPLARVPGCPFTLERRPGLVDRRRLSARRRSATRGPPATGGPLEDGRVRPGQIRTYLQ
jgi:hypothetical protein